LVTPEEILTERIHFHFVVGDPKMLLTPHIVSKVEAEPAARAVIDNIRHRRAGLPPIGLVDRSRGH
jgi:glyoxylate/hydroxypyruvate reductase A